MSERKRKERYTDVIVRDIETDSHIFYKVRVRE